MVVIAKEKAGAINALSSSVFSTGKLTVYPSQNRILLEGSSKTLQPKIMELLILLCATQGQTLSKDELIISLWPEVHVGPDSLANTMTRLRRALGDNARQPEFIETVQSKGYRWLQTVKVEKPMVQSRLKARPLLFLVLPLTFVITLGGIGGAIFIVGDEDNEQQGFPYKDLYIEETADGLVVEVGIKGELTEEKKAQMLKDIKRITGNNDTNMEFTLDDPQVCQQTAGEKNQAVHCKTDLKVKHKKSGKDTGPGE